MVGKVRQGLDEVEFLFLFLDRLWLLDHCRFLGFLLGRLLNHLLTGWLLFSCLFLSWLLLLILHEVYYGDKVFIFLVGRCLLSSCWLLGWLFDFWFWLFLIFEIFSIRYPIPAHGPSESGHLPVSLPLVLAYLEHQVNGLLVPR
jgi:hypothetical protein